MSALVRIPGLVSFELPARGLTVSDIVRAAGVNAHTVRRAEGRGIMAPQAARIAEVVERHPRRQPATLTTVFVTGPKS